MKLEDCRFGPEPGREHIHKQKDLLWRAEQIGKQTRMESPNLEMNLRACSAMMAIIDECDENFPADFGAQLADAWEAGWRDRDELIRLTTTS